MNSPITWIGGKGLLKNKIIPLLPEHKIYVEVFGGGASVLFGKPLSEMEVYNDIDSGLYNFFMVISHPEKFKLFYEQISLYPYSRELYYDCLKTWKNAENEIDKAIRWYVCARQSFSGGYNNGWGFSITDTRHIKSRWLSTIKNLPEIHKRLQKICIENKDWEFILETYDTKDTLFYLDPPYVHSTRKKKNLYQHEMGNKEHKKLIDYIQNIEGQFVLSGYDNEIYKSLYKYEKHIFNVYCYAEKVKGKKRNKRTEYLWIKRHIKNTLF